MSTAPHLRPFNAMCVNNAAESNTAEVNYNLPIPFGFYLQIKVSVNIFTIYLTKTRMSAIMVSAQMPEYNW